MIKLIQNETIKTLKKTSTKILIILAIIALFAAVGFSKLTSALNNYTEDMMNQESEWEEETKNEINYLKSNLTSNNGSYDEVSIAEIKAQIDIYELSLKYHINYIYNYKYYWKIEALLEIQNAKNELYLDNNKEDNEKKVEKICKILEQDNYSEYIKLLKEEQKEQLENKTITEEQYNDNIYLLNIREKYGIYEKEDEKMYWKESLYTDIESMKESLRTGVNTTTNKLLKLEEVEKLQDKIKIAEYRLENNIPTLETMSSDRGMYDMFAPSFSMLIVALLMVIITGSSISTEISKGTIKFLLFTPNKRWKILASKIISAIVILLVMALGLSIFSLLIGNIFFDEAVTSYVYIKNNEVHAMQNSLYTILYFLSSCIDILVYMFFAFMLSVITRNTALSVGLSIASYVGSGIVMNLLNYYISSDWVKFIPFNNFGLTDKIFANNISYNTMQMASEYMNQTTIGFSLGVLGVCIILMIVTMFDSFNKRDIV